MNVTFILPSSSLDDRGRKESNTFIMCYVFFLLMQYLCFGINSWTSCHMLNIHACKYANKCLDRWCFIFTTKVQISLEICFILCGPLAHAIVSFQVHRAKFNFLATSMEKIPPLIVSQPNGFSKQKQIGARLTHWSQLKL